MEKFIYDYISPKTIESFKPYLPKGFSFTEEYSRKFIIGVAQGSNSCGAIYGEIVLNELYIESIFVDEAVRRQGVGTALTKAALSAAEALYDVLADSLSYSFFMTEEDASEVNAFLTALGFKVYHDEGEYSYCYKFPTSNLRRVPTICRCFNDNFTPSPNICRLSSVDESLIRDFISHNQVESFLDYFQVTDAPLDEMSLCYLSSGQLQGYIVFEKLVDGVVLNCAYTLKTAPIGTLLHLITTAAHYGVETMGEDYNYYINPMNKLTLGLVNRISGGSYHKLKHYSAHAEI